MASSGCSRRTSSFVALSKSVPKFLLYKLPGTCLNWTRISALYQDPLSVNNLALECQSNNKKHKNKRNPSAERALSHLLVWRAFPAFMRNGTPSHRALLIKRAAAANVGVMLSLWTVGSSIYPGYDFPPLLWPLYWPMITSSSCSSFIDLNTFTWL